MKYYRIKCEIYKAEGKSWERMAEELLLSAVRGGGKEHGGKVVRLVFFTFCEDNREYQLQRSFLEQWVDDHFVSPRPVLSLVAQKPLVGELVMEVHSLPTTAGEEVTVEEQMISSVRYLRVTSGHYSGRTLCRRFDSSCPRTVGAGVRESGRNAESGADELR